jgi:DNA-binding response OmpR family regulator
MDVAARRPLILLVGDDRRTASTLATMLREDGFAVELASGAELACRLAEAPVPDALVTDISIGSLDASRVAAGARSRRAGMPLFVVTGYPLLAAKSAARIDPPPTILTKPLDYDLLAQRLRAVLA